MLQAAVKINYYDDAISAPFKILFHAFAARRWKRKDS